VAARSLTTEVAPGDAASLLLDTARDHKADLLVVGSHGSTGLDRFLLGSVSEKVLRHAGCSVLIVR
jgi:nucleotide-binding universal stress UspA family protein